jgi:hypothetical protein
VTTLTSIMDCSATRAQTSLSQHDRLGQRLWSGPCSGAVAYVLHLAWVLLHLPGPHKAHQHYGPAHLALSQDLLEQGTLQRLEQDAAGPADVAHGLWADLCRVSRADA